jgi:methylated-DNA-[protein]-cysteine S-methyltransferase
MKTFFTMIESPLGPLKLKGDDQGHLIGLYMEPHRHEPDGTGDVRASLPVFTAAERQLAEYFEGKRREFDLPLSADGTSFQREVWRALRAIPFGVTISYGELARRVGNPAASRAVGLANGRNPISIIVPCHRVIGATGKLTGYGGGVPRKEWLLGHERRLARDELPLARRPSQVR